MDCVRNWWILLVFVVFWENHVIEVLSQTDGKLKCPVTWTDQTTVTLICEVFESSVDSTACPGNNGEFSFGFTSKNGFPVTSCTLSSYFDAACDGIFNANGCRCKEKTGNNTYILQYNVTVDAARYQGGSWQCLPACEDSSNFPITKTFDEVGNCTDLQISTTTAAATTTTATTTTATTTAETATTEGIKPRKLMSFLESPDRWLLFLLLLIPVAILGSWVTYLYCCLGRATADKDWNGYKTSNLHFKKGDIISLLENEGSFWKGEINNQTGVFPKDFVHVRKNSGDVRTVEALHNWNQDNELTFKSGSTIYVRKQMETVWQGIQCCKIGWFPHSDVTLKKKGICWKQSDSDNMTMNCVHNSPTA